MAGARTNPDDDFRELPFVGRIAPNGDRGSSICLAEHYKGIDSHYRFIFVGRYDAVPRYYSTIRALMSEYRMLNERFVFTGPVPDEDLAIYYSHAAVYIALSEHEGFCAPLIEAMAAGVPILAYAAAAVPETLGGAGLQFAPKDLEYAAELAGALAFDDDLRSRIIAGQRRRLADFGDDHIVRQLGSILRDAIPGLRQNGSAPRHAEGGQRDTSSAGAAGPPESMKIALIVQRYGPKSSADPSTSAA